jgi:hypothetical protein
MSRLTQCHCGEQATHVVWCPTWIGTDKGPIGYCDKDVKVFTENEHAKSGQFFFGQEAHDRFNSVEAFIPSSDPRFMNALGMVRNFTILKQSSLHCTAYVVDGKVWLFNDWANSSNFSLLMRLGSWPDVREEYPKLFAETTDTN